MSDRSHGTGAPRLTVITLGVSDMRASIAFYEALGFARKFRVDRRRGRLLRHRRHRARAVSLVEAGARCGVARPAAPRRHFAARRWPGIAARREEVDAVLAFAVAKGARLLQAAQRTDYGGYCGYLFRSGRSSLGSRGGARHRGRRGPAGSSAGLSGAAGGTVGLLRMVICVVRTPVPGCADGVLSAASPHDSPEVPDDKAAPKHAAKAAARTETAAQRRDRGRAAELSARARADQARASGRWPAATRPGAGRWPVRWWPRRWCSIPSASRRASTIPSG